MLAVVKTKAGYDNVELLEVEEPKVYGDRVKIEVAYTGICGSDIHTFKGEYNSKGLPVILGHEFSGIVAEVGPDVKNIKVGDRVTSETTFETCEDCIYCESKDYNLCSKRKGIGTQANGSMTKYVISREESCHVLPDNVSLEAASLTEPLACCTHSAMEKTNINKDDVVLVIGPGPIGLLLAQVVKSKGAKVILTGITRDIARLELAKELGIDITIDTLKENLEEIILKETNGYGVDKAFDCSGSVVAVNSALSLVKKKGDFVQVGLFAEKSNLLDQESIIQRELQYIGSRSQKPSSWKLALDLLENNKIAVDKMITKIFDLKDSRQAFEEVMKGTEIKVLIKS
ncbi:zinc-binding dehydrogenase [Gemella sp. GH3]|uniref:zinc-binding dehydrogenase n=1 Tax=unclassified Gemella TaxID=2624949 RepID=UPI0015CFBCDC|nr:MULTISPECIES: zinc-binding dehydrogenase [unclassified Gemella]MBF0714021.1 zinc-binding dehydrogenase [Gemella sp. GH3.1]NYS50973.1 zinc-binding dehydrogenase [Gemella sp. GH3]